VEKDLLQRWDWPLNMEGQHWSVHRYRDIAWKDTKGITRKVKDWQAPVYAPDSAQFQYYAKGLCACLTSQEVAVEHDRDLSPKESQELQRLLTDIWVKTLRYGEARGNTGIKAKLNNLALQLRLVELDQVWYREGGQRSGADEFCRFVLQVRDKYAFEWDEPTMPASHVQEP
jgi:hypothetical protein